MSPSLFLCKCHTRETGLSWIILYSKELEKSLRIWKIPSPRTAFRNIKRVSTVSEMYVIHVTHMLRLILPHISNWVFWESPWIDWIYFILGWDKKITSRTHLLIHKLSREAFILHPLFAIFPKTIYLDITDLKGVLTKFQQALDEVILCLCQQLLDSLATFGQGDCAVPQVAQDAPKVFPTAIDQDPTWNTPC